MLGERTAGRSVELKVDLMAENLAVERAAPKADYLVVMMVE